MKLQELSRVILACKGGLEVGVGGGLDAGAGGGVDGVAAKRHYGFELFCTEGPISA